MDFRQRLEQSRIKPIGSDVPADTEENFVCPYFATDKTKSPACLELRLSGGNHKAIPYSYFTEINFEADAGIEILTTQKRICIVGRNLGRLFDYLVMYRVKFVQANIGNDTEEDGLFVKEILVEEV